MYLNTTDIVILKKLLVIYSFCQSGTYWERENNRKQFVFKQSNMLKHSLFSLDNFLNDLPVGLLSLIQVFVDLRTKHDHSMTIFTQIELFGFSQN